MIFPSMKKVPSHYRGFPDNMSSNRASSYVSINGELSSKACLIRRGNHGPGNQDFLADLGPLM